ncbi:MAG: hypothetical protein GXP55_12065 [Deltaproteobacteria bacterium]|nr:hypothetical protein [Deltaproteobacteria bacterium]
MRAVAHVSVARAEVRGRRLGRHAARVLAGGSACAVASARGWPRLFAPCLEVSLDGFAACIGERCGSPEERLEKALEAAREALAAYLDRLVERVLPDVALTAFVLGDGALHAARVGGGRVYMHRRGKTARLTPRGEPGGGLLTAPIERSDTNLRSGDLILAGSSSAFSANAVEAAAEAVARDPSVPPSVLANMLTTPAADAAIGAVALVARVR